MSTNFSGKDRRKSPRVKVELVIVYKVNTPLIVSLAVGWDAEVDALVLDLSQTGMAIQTKYDIPVGTVLSLYFTLIDLSKKGENRIDKMSITSEVKTNSMSKSGEYRLGISFIKIEPRDQLAIAEFVRTKNL